MSVLGGLEGFASFNGNWKFWLEKLEILKQIGDSKKPVKNHQEQCYINDAIEHTGNLVNEL